MTNADMINTYESKNAQPVLEAVNACIKELEEASQSYFPSNPKRMKNKGYTNNDKVFRISEVCEELSIFDWWGEYLSMSQLKQMKKFLETAISLGFTGYVCFKVGAKYCAHGMWAHKEESTTGYSPDGDCLFHSFRSGDNYYDMKLSDVWMHDKYATADNRCPDFTLKQIKAELESR